MTILTSAILRSRPTRESRSRLKEGSAAARRRTKDEYLVIPEMLDCARVIEAAIRKVPA